MLSRYPITLSVLTERAQIGTQRLLGRDPHQFKIEGVRGSTPIYSPTSSLEEGDQQPVLLNPRCRGGRGVPLFIYIYLHSTVTNDEWLGSTSRASFMLCFSLFILDDIIKFGPEKVSKVLKFRGFRGFRSRADLC